MLPSDGEIISLRLWYLQLARGCKSVKVVGFREVDDNTLQRYASSPIVSRESNICVQSKNHKYKLFGTMDEDASDFAGFPRELLVHFRSGFPQNWDGLLEEFYEAAEIDRSQWAPETDTFRQSQTMIGTSRMDISRRRSMAFTPQVNRMSEMSARRHSLANPPPKRKSVTYNLPPIQDSTRLEEGDEEEEIMEKDGEKEKQREVVENREKKTVESISSPSQKSLVSVPSEDSQPTSILRRSSTRRRSSVFVVEQGDKSMETEKEPTKDTREDSVQEIVEKAKTPHKTPRKIDPNAPLLYIDNWTFGFLPTKKDVRIVLLGNVVEDTGEMFEWQTTEILSRDENGYLITGRRRYELGRLDEEMLLECGFPRSLIDKFFDGFPVDWKATLQEVYRTLVLPSTENAGEKESEKTEEKQTEKEKEKENPERVEEKKMEKQPLPQLQLTPKAAEKPKTPVLRRTPRLSTNKAVVQPQPEEIDEEEEERVRKEMEERERERQRKEMEEEEEMRRQTEKWLRKEEKENEKKKMREEQKRREDEEEEEERRKETERWLREEEEREKRESREIEEKKRAERRQTSPTGSTISVASSRNGHSKSKPSNKGHISMASSKRLSSIVENSSDSDDDDKNFKMPFGRPTQKKRGTLSPSRARLSIQPGTSVANVHLSRSGRLVRPPLAQWAGERIVYDKHGEVVKVEGMVTQSHHTIRRHGAVDTESICKHYGVSSSPVMRTKQAESRLSLPKPEPKVCRKVNTAKKETYYSDSDDDYMDRLRSQLSPVTPGNPINKKRDMGYEMIESEDSEEEEERRLEEERAVEKLKRKIQKELKKLQGEYVRVVKREKKLKTQKRRSVEEKESRKSTVKKVERKKPVKKEKKVAARRSTRAPPAKKRKGGEIEENEESSEYESDDDAYNAFDDPKEDSGSSSSSSESEAEEVHVVPHKNKPIKKADIERLKLAISYHKITTDADWEIVSKALDGLYDAEMCKELAISRLQWSPPIETEKENEPAGVTAKQGTIGYQIQAAKYTRDFVRAGGDDDFFKDAPDSPAIEMTTAFDPDDSMLELMNTPTVVNIPKGRGQRKRGMDATGILSMLEEANATQHKMNITSYTPVQQGSAQRERKQRYVTHIKHNGTLNRTNNTTLRG